MAKYQVLRRVKHTTKNERNELVEGQMVEFLMIPENADGPSQVQVYFVPDKMTDEQVLGAAAQHHENEIRERPQSFSASPQFPVMQAKPEVEEMVQVSRKVEVETETFKETFGGESEETKPNV